MEEFIVTKINNRLLTVEHIVLTYCEDQQMDDMSYKLGNKLGIKRLVRSSRNSYGTTTLGNYLYNG